MPEINSFPNNSSEYIGAEEVMHWLHGRTKGVYAGDGNAAVTAVSGQMQVSVAPGIGWMTNSAGQGICWWYDSAQVLNIDPAESTGTLDRIDRIVIQWRTVDYADKPELIVLKGTDSSSAVPPALTNNATLRQISLAQITIPAGTTELTSLNIIDERFDPAVCGIVTETVTADTTVIAAQYEEALQTLYAAIAQAWSGVISDGAITYEKLSPELQEELGGALYFTAVAVAAATGDIATVSNAKITADHVLAEITFANPSAITTVVTWTTSNGSLVLNGTCTSATTANIVLVKKNN